ncbi:aldo/keto reductase [Isoptericola sp. NEAU-Y5]|uniref:Aldo/keto reductase n=1 Tax=Isoptericola luteus TaxID=2879484 RepID=A0ABS7ZGM2_9MICO|nr:aldo/keto reductase [Isoptericola sp. NEAU-Y5]MCA5894183.1 aldo/keto reductase [Isoptericola sp. NEAU-Y5]
MAQHPTNADGLTLPAVGLGTYRLRGRDGTRAVAQALDLGYRLLDSAVSYQNEGTVGAGVRASAVPREDVVVTSKLPGRYYARADALATVEESVARTGLDHLDLYLLHWPNPARDQYVEAWTALIEARERGLVRAIGVSNFLPEHLDRLAAETGVVPAVNQIEMHPYFPQPEQRAYDAAHGIVTQAWSPLGRANEMLEDPVLAGIARDHDATVPEIILAWHTRLGVVPLPKASSADRQRQNLEAGRVALTETDLDTIAGLARPDGRIADQDPARYEEL